MHPARANAPFISFLSDYGLQDEFVGVCHGVIAQRCPDARVIDITHEIPPQDVLVGARTLRDSLRFMPAGVHLAIVDPGVGASGPLARRAVALRTRHGRGWLVGPDNGLLAPAAAALGGVSEALDIGASPERLLPLSATFHGRDLFSPVAAALANGARPESVGEPIDPVGLKGLLLPAAGTSSGVLCAHVVGIDRFGNVVLDGTMEQLESIGLQLASNVAIETHGQRSTGVRGRAFADVPPGAILLYLDSREMISLAVNEGSAAQMLGLSHGDLVEVRSA